MIIIFGKYNSVVPMLPEALKNKALEVVEAEEQCISEAVSKIKNSTHYDYSIFDADIFSDSDDEILKSIYLYKSITNSHIILITRGRMRGDTLLSGLIDMGVYDFITSLDDSTAKSQMQECVLGRSQEDVACFLSDNTPKNKKPFSLFKAKKKMPAVKISIAGVLPRIGTTTQAIRFLKYLIEEKKIKACYAEINTSAHINIIAKVFSGVLTMPEYFIYKNVPMYPMGSSIDTEQYGVIVYDYGSDLGNDFSQSDMQLVIVGSTAWEMAAFAQKKAMLNGNNVKYIFSFTSEKEQADILDFMGEKWTDVFFADFSPDMFSEITEQEKNIFQKLLDKKGKFI